MIIKGISFKFSLNLNLYKFMKYLDNNAMIIFIIVIIAIILLGAYIGNSNKEDLMVVVRNNYKPNGKKWVPCHNSCYNIYDQARSEICKETCNNKYLF